MAWTGRVGERGFCGQARVVQSQALPFACRVNLDQFPTSSESRSPHLYGGHSVLPPRVTEMSK